MKNIVNLIIIIALSISCSKKDDLVTLNSIKSQLKVNNDFRSYLSLEYLRFSNKLKKEGDIQNSEYFAKKGLKISNGLQIIPENPLKWNADEAQIKLMIMMQKRLDDLMQNNALVNNIPIQLAHLTYLYDCWIAKESKSIHISDELARCRVRFTRLISEIEYYQNDLRKDRTKPVINKRPVFQHFKILFDYNSSDFNQKALSEMLKILTHLSTIDKNYRILLVGNTDKSGGKIYNKLLSLKRINTVKSQLIKNGLSKEIISYRAFGEDYPEIITSDGIKKQENRSVDVFIVIGENIKNFNKYEVPYIRNQIYKNNILKKKAITNIES